MMFMTGLSFLLATASFPGEVASSDAPEVELAVGYKVKNHVLEKAELIGTYERGKTKK